MITLGELVKPPESCAIRAVSKVGMSGALFCAASSTSQISSPITRFAAREREVAVPFVNLARHIRDAFGYDDFNGELEDRQVSCVGVRQLGRNRPMNVIILAKSPDVPRDPVSSVFWMT